MGILKEAINKYPGYVSVILTLDMNTLEDINNMDRKDGLDALNQIVIQKKEEAKKLKKEEAKVLYYTNM